MTTGTAPIRAGFHDVLLSEWTKLRTLQVTTVGLLGFVAASAVMSFVLTSGAAEEYASLPPEDQLGVSSLTLSLYGLLIAQLVIAVLGSMAMTSEYATGTIKTSVTAVPRRGRLLAAKAVVVSSLSFVAGIVAALGMVLVGQTSFNGRQVGAFTSLHLSDPEVVRAVLGAGLYMVLLGLLSLAVGTLVRWTAGAIVVLVCGVLIVPSMFESLPEGWSELLSFYWPTNAGLQIVLSGPDGLAPWLGFGVMAAFTAVLLAVAYAVLRLRDV
ncbi:ABC transporter permease [Nocardiopsis synnemataformans]|uniref:ABC transporter permease n=1 Tax=Nocardiopsis synnemataformans TaxID=61305 RepID=UPI003EB8B609